MTVPVCVADASALREMSRCVSASDHPALLTGLTQAVDDGMLGFPREVAAELEIISRGEIMCGWAIALTNKLKKWSGDITHLRPLMGHVQTLGFEQGFESLDNKEGCLAAVGCLCLDLTSRPLEFVLATEDTGTHPLRPTLEQLANVCGWVTMDAKSALDHLGLSGLAA